MKRFEKHKNGPKKQARHSAKDWTAQQLSKQKTIKLNNLNKGTRPSCSCSGWN